MIEKVDTSQIQGFLEKTSSRQQKSAAALSGNGADVSVQVDYASFIDSAMQIPQTDTQAVEKARQLLLSGQLESTEIIRQTAENIITFGI
ncbi:MAG: hypothetical protein HQ580_18520 [Planctomycetes bacterium]|nr:hypothetical protein [Planctomycetota bacterium]